MFTIEGKDKKGRPILWYRPELLKKSEPPQQRQRNKQLIIYFTEKLDKQYPNEGWVIASDASKINRENVDMDFYLFGVKVFMVYYLRSFKNLFGMSIPSALDDLVKIALDAMDDELRNRLKFIKFKELTDNYIDAKNVPSYFAKT